MAGKRILTVALVAVAASGAVALLAATRDAPPAAGTRVTELSGRDPVSGKRVSLADFRGKPVVVNVWASWCPGCRAEAEDLRRFAEAHPEAVVLGIDFQDTVSGAKEFYREFGWRHPSIFDPKGELTSRIGLQGLPTTVFLDEEHREVTRVVGEADFTRFEQGLEEAKRAS